MDIGPKLDLIKRVEDRLATTLTANDMSKTIIILKEELSNYIVDIQDENYKHCSDLLETYISAKLIEGRSDKTLARYKYILQRLFEEIKVPEHRVMVHHLRSFLANERKRGISDSTLEGYRSIFSSYFGWLHKEALIQQNPCSNLGPIKCPKVMRLPYSDVEIERMKESCGSVRDKALICFLLSTGCRVSEVVALNRTDVDMHGMQCKVLGKGDKERVVYIDNITRMYLKKYLQSRDDMLPALFTGKGSERLTAGGIRRLLNQISKTSGVDNVHPHRFRRTLATNLINRGMHIQEVARVLGHDRLDTTMEYIYIDDRDVQVNYRKYS